MHPLSRECRLRFLEIEKDFEFEISRKWSTFNNFGIFVCFGYLKWNLVSIRQQVVRNLKISVFKLGSKLQISF